MSLSARCLSTTAVLVLFPLWMPAVWAHGDHAQTMSHGDDSASDEREYLPTYFNHAEYIGWIYAHITLTVISCIFILPLAVMLSIAKSRLTLAFQALFFVLNAMSIFCAVIYNANTPDLYPNNAHHKIGWVITWVLCCHVLMSFAGRLADIFKIQRPAQYHNEDESIPLTRHNPWDAQHFAVARDSNDSGHGTEPNTASLRNSSECNLFDHDTDVSEAFKEYTENGDEFTSLHLTPPSANNTKFTAALTSLESSVVWKYAEALYRTIDRIILPFSFVALVTGIATYGRFFEGRGIFSGLAHWVKGGVFFWLGLLTLGRWSGSFAELGWAWNLRSKQSKGEGWQTPSAEFVESFLIFFYGSTNIFLEHLGNWGKAWTAQDLEHVSLTVLFIGGGLLGMLVESRRIREFLNITASGMSIHPDVNADEEAGRREEPRTYQLSLNPIPALVILLMGIMMSSHEQSTMISSMIHKQWGNLLTGAAFCRGLTYVLLYLRPPQSTLPSRPPTEILAAFGLIAGGIIFMASSSDTVDGMIHYELDAMFMYTVTMGFVGVLMAWEIVVLAVKGWAVRQKSSVIFA